MEAQAARLSSYFKEVQVGKRNKKKKILKKAPTREQLYRKK